MYWRLTRQCDAVAGANFSAVGSHTMPTMKAVTGTVDALDIGGEDPVLRAQPEHGVDVRMDDVRGGEGLERRVAALPVRPRPSMSAAEVRRRIGVLQVRREEAEASLEDLHRAGRAGARQVGGDDSALRRPPGVQKLRVACRPPSTRGCPAAKLPQMPAARAVAVGVQTEQPARQIGRAERAEESGRMKAALVELTGRHAADAAGDLVADGDRGDEARVPTPAVISASASADATDGLLMCTIDSLCVSSYSSACEKVPLASAARVTPTRSPVPRMRARPGRRQRDRRIACRAPERRVGAGERTGR